MFETIFIGSYIVIADFCTVLTDFCTCGNTFLHYCLGLTALESANYSRETFPVYS